jgi:Rieske [2Fe-2S] domain
MTDPQRIDRLTEPAVVGRTYLVPTVAAMWPEGYVTAPWPVIGPKHTDVEFLNFTWNHYHVDARFVLSRAHLKLVHKLAYFSTPTSDSHHPLADVIWQPIRMRRKMPIYPERFRWDFGIRAIAAHYAGHQCKSGKGGWICPHRNAPLGSLSPVDGVITCPLHGLRIDAVSGKVLPI